MPAELASSLIVLYTGSIMGLLSTLAHFHENEKKYQARHLDS
jgi:hypothetical protein